MDEYYFITPEDVLMPRGNRAFGGAGEHGEAAALPWPSVFAGALRAALLGQDGQALAEFGTGRRPAGARGDVLGTLDSPGSFRLIWASFARVDRHGTAKPLVLLPSDLVAIDSKVSASILIAVEPVPPSAGVRSSIQLPLLPALRSSVPGKPTAGHLLDHAALAAYGEGRIPAATVPAAAVFESELRLGIALDSGARTAAEGALYTTEAIRFARRDELWPNPERQMSPAAPERTPSQHDAGYLVGVRGAAGLLGDRGILRLGGDARAAGYRRVKVELPLPPVARIANDNRFRLVLDTPALFRAGWLPDGVRRDGDGFLLEGDGFGARLACASVPRFEVVSGWDIARMRPKPAQRVVATGAVYWFDQLDGDARKLADWVDDGLWGDDVDPMRRAEGFNRARLAAWPVTKSPN